MACYLGTKPIFCRVFKWRYHSTMGSAANLGVGRLPIFNLMMFWYTFIFADNFYIATNTALWCSKWIYQCIWLSFRAASGVGIVWPQFVWPGRPHCNMTERSPILHRRVGELNDDNATNIVSQEMKEPFISVDNMSSALHLRYIDWYQTSICVGYKLRSPPHSPRYQYFVAYCVCFTYVTLWQ